MSAVQIKSCHQFLKNLAFVVTVTIDIQYLFQITITIDKSVKPLATPIETYQ